MLFTHNYKALIVNNYFALMLFCFITLNGFGQDLNFSRAIQWMPVANYPGSSDTKPNSCLNFENAVYNDASTHLPYYEEKIKLNSSTSIKYQLSLSQTFYEDVPESELSVISDLSTISDTISVDYNIACERKQPLLRYSFVPLRRNTQTGKIERLKFFSIKITSTSTGSSLKSTQSQTVYATQSVLNTGNWYKFNVSSSGIYQITYSQLKSIGLTNPENVQIYGNGGKVLSEVYASTEPDDLNEIPVLLMTGSDGIFNDGDYILFYAEGPVTWTYNKLTSSYIHQTNAFNDNASYFITSGTGGKRISAATTPTADANVQVTSFDGLACHEENLNNLIKSGQTWYGESFKSESSYSFSFSFPGLILSEPVSFSASAVGRSAITSLFDFYQNNQLISAVSVSSSLVNETLADYAVPVSLKESFTSTSEKITIKVSYDRQGNTSAIGWLDYLRLNVRQSLNQNSYQQSFRDIRSVKTGNIAAFSITGASSNTLVWDVTDINNVSQMDGTLQGTTYTFKALADDLHEYIVFDTKSGLLSPEFITENNGLIANQNLHGINDVDYVIITHSNFLSQAQELADLHTQNDGLKSIVVTQDQVFNEFSSGMTDPAAIRNFVKMLYDRATSTSNIPKYLLLFGDGSYDNKTAISSTSKNTNYIVTYESANSLSPDNSYVSDDYFGLLDNSETISSGLLDIGIGRLPVQTTTQATQMLTKIKKYMNTTSFGDWRNNICLTADDKDSNVHMQQADSLASYVNTYFPNFNLEKIYLDAYPRVSTSTGARYPEVNVAIQSQLNRGILIFNYTGHGGENGLAEEQIMRQNEDIKVWKNDNYPLFVTATCEFSRFDKYEITTAGEDVLLNPTGGGIGLLTTTRLVYSAPNFVLNQQFYRYAFVKSDDNPAYRLGDLIRKTKNTSGQTVNKLCFTLLGDPALGLAYPTNGIVTDSINHKKAEEADTLNAYSSVTIKGHITNTSGLKISNYDGIVYPTIFDKVKNLETLANDTFPAFAYTQQDNILFRGKASVKNGDFSFNLILPRDIDYNFGPGKISYYANDSLTDASGCFSKVIIGGLSTDITADENGPVIRLFINDTTFTNGGITDQYPTLLAKVSDLQGINPGGNGIGHDITATLDNDATQSYILNNFYQTDLDTYQKGSVDYQLPKMTAGVHTLTFKIWDIFNNSSQATIQFNVIDSGKLCITHLFNYPNPFSSYTNFFFEHNLPSEDLDVTIDIFNLTGAKVTQIHRTITSSGYTSGPIEWDRTNASGNKIRQGIYIYRVILRSSLGTILSEGKKLVIIN